MLSPPRESKKWGGDPSSISAVEFVPADEERISEPGATLRSDDDDESAGGEEWRARGGLPAAWACRTHSVAAAAGAKNGPHLCAWSLCKTRMESSLISGI